VPKPRAMLIAVSQMESSVSAPVSGTVKRVLVSEGKIKRVLAWK
jgi:pyruvate carboxylase